MAWNSREGGISSQEIEKVIRSVILGQYRRPSGKEDSQDIATVMHKPILRVG